MENESTKIILDRAKDINPHVREIVKEPFVKMRRAFIAFAKELDEISYEYVPTGKDYDMYTSALCSLLVSLIPVVCKEKGYAPKHYFEFVTNVVIAALDAELSGEL